MWSQVDFDAGTVEITSTLVRVRAEGLLRKGTKSQAGERTLALPPGAISMLRRRFMSGARFDQPLFPDVLGGFRDPANVRRELRELGVRRRFRGSPRTPFARPPRPSWTRLHYRRGWTPTSSATPAPR